MNQRTYKLITVFSGVTAALIVLISFLFEMPWSRLFSLVSVPPLIATAYLSNKKTKEFNKELYLSFKNNLESFRDELAAFILGDLDKDLERLINQIQNSSLSENSKSELLAEAHYLLARFHSATGSIEAEKVYENFVLAYEYQPNRIKYQERACTSLMALKKKEKALDLSVKVLRSKRHSARAWFVKASIQFNNDFTHSEIPRSLLKNKVYLYLVYNHLYQSHQLYNDEYKNLGQFDLVELPEEIDIDNIHYWIFKLAIVFNAQMQDLPRVSTYERDLAFATSPEIKWCHETALRIRNVLDDKDVLKATFFNQVYYFYHHSAYLLNGDTSDVFALVSCCRNFWKNEGLKAFVEATLVCLSQIEEYNEIIALSEDLASAKYDLDFLVGFAYSNLEQNGKALVHLKRHFENVPDVIAEESSNFIAFFHLLHQCDESPRKYYLDHIVNKQFDSSLTQLILELNSLQFVTQEVDEQQVTDIKNQILNEKEKLLRSQLISVAQVLLAFERGVEALEILDGIPRLEKEPMGLHLLIECLNSLKTDHDRLLESLETWRISFPARFRFLIMELEICERLKWYDRIEYIAEFGLKSFENDPGLLTYLILALSCQEGKEEKLDLLLDQALLQIDFKNKQLELITKILFRAKKFNLGLDLIYNRASVEINNFSLRNTYFALLSFYDKDIDFKEKISVEKDCTVKLTGNNGRSHLVHLSKEALINNHGFRKLLGHKKGENVTIESKYNDYNDLFKIDGIFNKYHGLLLQIIEEATQKKSLSGYDMVSVDWKGKDFEDMERAFVEQFGLSGDQYKEAIKDSFKKYEKRQIGFTFLAAAFARDKLYELFSDLTHDNSSGYWSLPNSIFKSKSLDQIEEFVPDFASICTFSLLDDLIDFSKITFVVPQSLIDLLQERVHSLEHMPSEFTSLDISVTGGVKPIFHTDKHKETLLNGYNQILNWIKRYCKVAYPTNKLDIISIKLEEFQESSLFSEYLIDTLMLANPVHRGFISDDLQYFQSFSHALCLSSPEYFIKYYFKEEYVSCQLELLRNNFIGITPTAELLQTAFEDNPILEAPNNVFRKALRSLPYNAHQDERTLFEVIDFLKFLFEQTLSKSFKMSIAETLFREVFRGYPRFNIQPEEITGYIRRNMSLLGNASTELCQCLINALSSLKKKVEVVDN
ncbi:MULTISPECIES: PIN domain-containing protein [Roseivirga]|uniref:PIN domain-containing protein n=1 Tax=Roseivirga spongicola TaxID=333140 RepID=A0A150XEY1_9BACT|nr:MULTISPECIES: hypothetical protein [Roseivirga]KYG77224.1 hypothetical protein AWW68_00195 [Roseivirga spongicola]MBO6662692.1 hypothetical protein [Roseivirga sp.]MBO6909699.1 hypothetical protein [Roseivirga sp.]WPZ10924.1 hypothetical protein T7867_02285 [Roseivirga spongicola]